MSLLRQTVNANHQFFSDEVISEMILTTRLVRRQAFSYFCIDTNGWLCDSQAMSQSILDSMSEDEIVRVAMRLLGSKTSTKKARSSRRNGKLAWSKKRKLTVSKRDAK